MKILLTTDGSKHSNSMIKKFAERSLDPKTKILIVVAYERTAYMMDSAPMGALKEYNIMANNFAIKLAENAAAEAVSILVKKHPKLIVSSITIEGSPKKVILKEADSFKADLIVVGSHGHGIVAGFLLGSVSQAIALHAKCSVEIVRK
ncbi:universal stress protein [soil metagenome]